MSVLAIIPIADHWLPGKSAWLLIALVVAFFLWIPRHNADRAARSRQPRRPSEDVRTADDR